MDLMYINNDRESVLRGVVVNDSLLQNKNNNISDYNLSDSSDTCNQFCPLKGIIRNNTNLCMTTHSRARKQNIPVNKNIDAIDNTYQ